MSKTNDNDMIIKTPRLNVAALWILVCLIFSTGIAWKQIIDAADTNARQWDAIKLNKETVSRVDAMSSDISDYKQSNKELTTAVNGLTIAVGSWNQKAERDKEDRIKTDVFMLKLSEDFSKMSVKIGRIEERLK